MSVGMSSSPAGRSSMTFSCSICEDSFGNPRDLATHILQAHCSEATEDPVEPPQKKVAFPASQAKRMLSKTSTHILPPVAPSAPKAWASATPPASAPAPPANAVPIPAAIKAILAPPPVSIPVSPAPQIPSPAPAVQVSPQVTSTTVSLPRAPTAEETKERFMTYRLSEVSCKYICLLCNKTYTSRYNIRMHMNMHTGNNVHTCPHCGRFFAHKHVFESHVRTHTGERPFACAKCGRTFGDRSNRLSHQKKCRGSGMTPQQQHQQQGQVGSRLPLASFTSQQAGQENKAHIVINSTFSQNNNYNNNNTNGSPQQSFHPQIVSVSSVKQDIKPEPEDEEEDPEPQQLNEAIYDDIVDDSLYDEDLEEIQIEPDIIDYGDESMSSSGQPTVHIQPVAPPPQPPMTTPTPTHIAISLPQTPVPLSNSAIFTCSFCNVKFNSQTELHEHLPKHVLLSRKPDQDDLERGYFILERPNGKTKFICLSCGKYFMREHQIKIHFNVHFGEKVFECHVASCGKKFAHLSVYESHLALKHKKSPTPMPEAKTDKDNQIIQDLHDEILTQIKQEEEEEEEFSEEPGYDDLDEPRLTIDTPEDEDEDEDHMITVVSATAESNCRRSNRPRKPKRRYSQASSESSNSNQGMTSDFYKPDNNSCNVVNLSDIDPPPSEEEFSRGFCHRKLNSGKIRLVCTTCGKHYTTLYNMRQHRNIHTGSGLHTCRYCGKDFTHKHIWETHERIHTGERPFKCPFCPRDFADRSNFNSHRKLCAKQKNGQN